MIIRDATIEDASTISRLMIELGYQLDTKDTISRIKVYHDNSDVVLIAEVQGIILGFLSFHVIPLFHQNSNLGRITAMCVSSQYHRQGLGRALLKELDNRALALNCDRIEVTSGNHRSNSAHLFYQSCGYEIDSKRFQKHLSKRQA